MGGEREGSPTGRGRGGKENFVATEKVKKQYRTRSAFDSHEDPGNADSTLVDVVGLWGRRGINLGGRGNRLAGLNDQEDYHSFARKKMGLTLSCAAGWGGKQKKRTGRKQKDEYIEEVGG